MAEKILTLKVTEEQAEQIKGFISFNDWNIDVKEEKVSKKSSHRHKPLCAKEEFSDPFHDENVSFAIYNLVLPRLISYGLEMDKKLVWPIVALERTNIRSFGRQ